MIDPVWLSYRLSDFIMFSTRVYERQLVLHNEQYAGFQIVSSVMGAFVLWRVLQHERVRAAFGTIGVVWVWVGWSFLWDRYAEINLLARYAAPAFVLEGFGFLAIAFLRRPPVRLPSTGWIGTAALTLMGLVLAGYPLVPVLTGGEMAAGEIFGMMPDPTALFTFALLAACRGALRWFLMVIPALWLATSIATLQVLGTVTFWPLTMLFATITLVALVSAFLQRRDARKL